MATIKDVARDAGVSVATVSRVINNSPKASKQSVAAVTVAMKKLGYRPNANARALVNQSTNTVGVLVSDVADPFFGAMVKAVDNVAHEHGKHILVCNGYHDEEQERKAIELLINSRCESLVIHAKSISDEELIAYADEVPALVIINRSIPGLETRCIALDNYRGAYMATEHLIKLGHKNIACLASSHEIEDSTQRVEGYQAALDAHNINLPASFIEYGEPNNDGGETSMTNLLAKSLKMTAIVSYNDYMAAGAISVLQENSRQLPDEISIIGFDDGLIARYLQPRLTTVRYPIALMAEKAARLSIALARGEKDPSEVLMFSPTLVKRDSVQKHAD